jgi:hypothetical protein
MAAAGSMAHFALQPGLVAGLVPWWLTGWHMRHPLPSWAWAPLRTAGVALLAAGAVVIVQAFVRFVVDGMGTPAPIAPTEQLVVSGPYRYVRNPMYLAVIAAIVAGRWLSAPLLLYATASGSPWPPRPTATGNPASPPVHLQYAAYRRSGFPLAARYPWQPGRPAARRDQPEPRAGPPGIPHGFTNLGPGRARLVCIHAAPAMQTEFIE